MLDVGDDDRAELDLEQADLLAQDDAEEQVERPDEDIEIQIEVQVKPGSHQPQGRETVGRRDA